MLKEEDHCSKIIRSKFNKPLVMSDKKEQLFEIARECHICGQEYSNKDGEVRV